MAETQSGIVEFRITLRDQERRQPKLSVQELIKDRIHQSADLSDLYYAPSDAYAELKATWSASDGTLSMVKTIPADSVAVLHCSTYVKRFDHTREELNIKAIVLSKGYDIGVCTGRSFVKYACSDLMYADRFFSYRFGDRKYWFICYLSSLDDAELISDKFVELFGARRGAQVFAWLKEVLSLERARSYNA
ncbi:MAG: hypothetical protein ABSD89_08600 [Halobacteriota archaeon]|jgi:hypothetical protein